MATERFEHNFPGYEILSQLGRGNARVLKARNQLTGELVAIKHFAINTDADTLKRFQRESEIMKVLKHPNIVKIKEVRLEASLPYLVMELIEGGDLRSLLKQRGSLTVSEVVALGTQLSRALHIIHENGITHRDIKPENIMFRVLPNDELHFLLTDFGIAKLREQSHTVTGTSMMTYEYASPEQFDDPKSVTATTDYYSLGVVLYESLTGQVPFPLQDSGMVAFIQKIMTEKPPPIILPHGQYLPPTLDTLIKGLLAKTKSLRISNARDMEMYLLQGTLDGATNFSVEKEIPEASGTKTEKPRGIVTERRGSGSAVKAFIVVGILAAIGIMFYAIGKWKQGNNLVIKQTATVADTAGYHPVVVRDTMSTMGSFAKAGPHHKIGATMRSFDTVTTTIEYPEGKYVGQVVGNVKNGLGTFFWDDGDRYSGYFVNGEKEGRGTFYYKNRDLYVGEWKNGKKEGPGTLYTSELSYEGGFADDYFDGFGTLKANENRIVTNCPDCRTFKGYWKEDMKEGFGECYDKDGQLIYQGNFADDLPVDQYPNVERDKKP